MPKYQVVSIQVVRTTYYYDVEAPDEEAAENLVDTGQVEPTSVYTKDLDGDFWVQEIK
jgi:hypothetical protein